MKRSKRVISFLLSILMVVSVFPMNVFAEETTNQYTLNSYGQRQYFAGDAINIAPEVDGVVGSSEYSIAKVYDIATEAATTGWVQTKNDTDNYWVVGNEATTDVGVYVSYDAEYIYLAATSTAKTGVERKSSETVEFAISVTGNTDEVLDIVVNQNGGINAVYKQYATGVDSPYNGASSVDDYSGFVAGSAATIDTATNTLGYELKLSRSGLAGYWNTAVADKFLCRIQVNTIASVENSTKGAVYWMATNNSGTGKVGDYTTFMGRIGHAIFLGKDSDFTDILGDSYSYCTEHNYTHYIAYNENGCKQICDCGATSDAVAHDYDTPIVTRPAGQVVDGEQTKVCKNCSYEYTEVLPAVGAANKDDYGYNTYTMMGNNILQSYIRENNYGVNGYDDPFAVLPTERMEGLMAAYEYYNPDIITFQECDEGWHDLLDAGDGLTTLGYAAATDGFTTEELRMIRNVIYYKTDVLEVVDAGYESYGSFKHGTIANPWCFTWAVLASKESNERFVVSSTHVPAGDDSSTTRNSCAEEQIAKLTEVSAKYSAPIVFMGDFNEVETGDSYQTLAGNFADARKSAETVVNSEYGTTNVVGSAPLLVSNNGKQIDHCFYSSGIDAIKYETVVEELSYAYSDHVPQRLYFKLDGGTSYNFENITSEELEKAGFNTSVNSSGDTLLTTPYTYENFRVSLDVYGGSKTGIVIGKKDTFDASGVDTSVGIIFNGDQVELTGGIDPSTAEVSKSAIWNPNNAPTYIYKPSDTFTFVEGNVYTLNVEMFHGVLTVWVDGYSGRFSVQTADAFNMEAIALLVEANGNGALKAFNVEEIGVIARPYAADDFATYRTDKTETDEDSNAYYVNVPTYKGYTFSGWFYDKACTQSVANTVTTLDASTTVYAKFVSQYVLKVKAQISSHLQDKYWSNGDEEGRIRFVTTIDSKKYSKAGFILNYTLDGEPVEKMVGSNKVYSTLYAEVGDKDSGQFSYKPNEEFCKSSAYFKSYTFTGVGEEYYNVDFTATPYWVTKDGTLVKGETSTKSVDQGIDNGFLSGKSALFLGDSAAYGIADEPENDYHHTGWAGRLERNYGMTSEIVAEDGAALVKYGVEKQLYNATKDQYDFVVLEGGAHDVLADSITIQTDAESLIKIAKQEFPNAIVVYVISNAFGADTEKMTAYVSAIKGACELYGITYVDLSVLTELTQLNLSAEQYDLVTPIIAKHLSDVESHTRCICGLDENGEHFGACDGTELLWEAWISTTSLPTTSGNYYLTGDVTTQDGTQTTIAANSTVNLDLNGHTVTNNASRIYSFASVHGVTGVTFNITDFSEGKTGTLKSEISDQGTIFWIADASNKVSLYAGVLDASKATYANGTLGCAVNAEAGTFNIYGGTIKGNSTHGDSINGLSVSIGDGAALNMSGGTIIGGRSSVAGNLYMRGTMNMSGGTITGGSAIESGEEGCGNVSIFGTFTMTGGIIDGNVCLKGDKTITLGGTAVINENETTGKGLTILSGKTATLQSLTTGASIAVNGEAGTIATNASEKDTDYVYLDESAGFGEVIFNEASSTLERTNTKTSCICGLDEYGNHYGDCTGIELSWSEWTSENSLPESGTYCLTTDVTVTSATSISGTLNLDLNGKTITSTGTRVYQATNASAIFNITDLLSEKSGRIANTKTEAENAEGRLLMILSGGKINLYAGILDASNCATAGDSQGNAVWMNGDASAFNVFGGSIQGNTAPTTGYGLNIHITGGTFTMDGGTVTGGKSKNAGNVHLESGAKMVMTGGIITGGTATSTPAGGNIHVAGTMTMTGGIIGGNVNWSGDNTLTLGGNAVINSDATTGQGLTIPSGTAVSIGTFEEGASIAVNGEVGTIATNATESDVNYVYLDESAGFGEVIYNETSSILERTNTKTSCICGLDENGKHFGDCDGTELTWTAWTDSAKVPNTDGNYCLTVDVNVSSQQTIYGKVNLDLNGHKITSTSRVYNTFGQTDKCLNITDLSEEKKGSIISTATSTAGAVIYLSGTNCSVNMYAGILDGSKATCNNSTLGCAMQMDSGIFNLYDGTVKGNSNPENSEYGLSVRVNNGASFNMSGGTITGGTSGEAGNVYMAGTMNMTGGTITSGTATAVETGGNMFVNGTLNIYGGMIGNTTIYSATDVENESTLRLGGNATVTYNAQ